MAEARDQQVGGEHYRSKLIQPWDAMRAWMSQEAFEGFLQGNVIKYIARYKDKNGHEDLLKAQHYLARLLEVVPEKLPPQAPQPGGSKSAIASTLSGNWGPWRVWPGKEPHPTGASRVEVETRNGDRQIGNASFFSWAIDNEGSDIALYRVWKENPLREVLENPPNTPGNWGPWQEWYGKGLHPIKEMPVEVETLNGLRLIGPASIFNWDTTGGDAAIIKYRVRKEPA